MNLGEILISNICGGLKSQSKKFQSYPDRATTSSGTITSTFGERSVDLAQGHNTAEVGFEPPTSRYGVRCSTTEPRARSPPTYVPILKKAFKPYYMCNTKKSTLLSSLLICLQTTFYMIWVYTFCKTWD